MVFSFHHLKVDYVDGQKWSDTPFRFMELKQLLTDWAVGIQAGGGWQASFFNNHDQPRALNRFGDAGTYRVQSAQMLAAATHLTRGTPYIYMGEEIGMTDPVYESMDDYVDIESHNAYKILCNEGIHPADAFKIITKKSRDNSRTPMQWTSGANAGFTSGKPWLRPTSHDEINVEAEEREGQILPFYRRLVQLRHDMPLIAEGTYEPFAREHESVYAFVREHEGQRLLVLNNFYGTETSLKISVDFATGSVLLSNYGQTELGETLTLAPYQTLAILANEKTA